MKHIKIRLNVDSNSDEIKIFVAQRDLYASWCQLIPALNYIEDIDILDPIPRSIYPIT